MQLESGDHANSPRNPLNLFAFNHTVAISRRREEFGMHVSCFPEPSVSRYWCILKAKLFSGSPLNPAQTAALPLEFHVNAPVHAVPGIMIICVAPEA